jgi:hypothetical protein
LIGCDVKQIRFRTNIIPIHYVCSETKSKQKERQHFIKSFINLAADHGKLNNPADSKTMNKNEKMMSRGQQNKSKRESIGQDYELSAGAESEKDRSTKRLPTGT